MNETEKQVMGETQRGRLASLEDRVAQLADRLSARLDRQGSVLDRLVAIQEARNGHQDALDHIQTQHTLRIKGLDERLLAHIDRIDHHLSDLEDQYREQGIRLAVLEERPPSKPAQEGD